MFTEKKPSKPLWIPLLLALTLFVSYGIPRNHYESPDFLSKLMVPDAIGTWVSRDLSHAFKASDSLYFFIDKIFARQYANDHGQNILFLILDAGNFHHPKVCFKSSGYEVKPLDDITLEAAGHPLQAHVLQMNKGLASVIVIYWMCIDQKPVSWVEQKWIQFFFSVFQKQKIGLMGRLEIPIPTGNIDEARKLAQTFIREISPGIPQKHADYLFGK